MTHRLIIALIIVLALLASALWAGASPVPAAASFHALASTNQVLGGFNPAQLEAAYDFGPLTAQGIDGTGQNIALIEFDSFNLSDLQQFDTENNLPDPTVQQYYVGGKRFTLQNSGETTLDLEWAHALAPGATIQIYYLNGNQSNKAGWKSLAKAVKQAAANSATSISMSFGACNASSGYKTTESALAAVEKKGVSVFVSSGDTGAYPGPRRQCGQHIGVGYPASDPSVVSVGGTTLQLNEDNTIGDEIAWRLSGGGKGSPLLRPVWQIITQLANAKYRWAPDVAFVADPQTGVAIYDRGQWQVAGGTSLGAPAWAAIWALVRQDAQQSGKAVGAAPPIVYRIANSPAYSQAFHDVTEGDNGYYQASVGWDPLTGWGTPDVAQFAAAALAAR
jgi:kumamolisin